MAFKKTGAPERQRPLIDDVDIDIVDAEDGEESAEDGETQEADTG